MYDALVVERQGECDRRGSAPLGVRPQTLDQAERRCLLVLGDLRDVVHGRGRDA